MENKNKYINILSNIFKINIDKIIYNNDNTFTINKDNDIIKTKYDNINNSIIFNYMKFFDINSITNIYFLNYCNYKTYIINLNNKSRYMSNLINKKTYSYCEKYYYKNYVYHDKYYNNYSVYFNNSNNKFKTTTPVGYGSIKILYLIYNNYLIYIINRSIFKTKKNNIYILNIIKLLI